MNDLTLIYNFQSPQNTDLEFRPASYRVIYAFTEQGFVEEAILRELCKFVPEANHVDMTFLNLDDLKVYAQRVSQEVQAKELRLISVQDYNIGLDGAKDFIGYQEVFTKFGEVIQNENSSKKKGFLGKFFGA
jgi:hypothetical protein